eukprot:TRINITY_DN11380_c1_g1_i1.p1 TRINITY_DN11380_c1_g1~~TRINITY_DN11380_c1_g1_i1.p1  ORF type:complete len:254 (+),score=53.43 TRINITY_DN11380_c1_g1_i1:92-853(+)
MYSLLGTIATAAGPAIGEGIAAQLRPQPQPQATWNPTTWGSSRVASALGLVGAAGLATTTYNSRWTASGVLSSAAGVMLPTCSSTRFYYTMFGADIAGTIHTTVAGLEATVTCDGENEYVGPRLVCKKVMVNLLSFHMEQYVFVNYADRDKSSPLPITPMSLRCGGGGASSSSSWRMPWGGRRLEALEEDSSEASASAPRLRSAGATAAADAAPPAGAAADVSARADAAVAPVANFATAATASTDAGADEASS